MTNTIKQPGPGMCIKMQEDVFYIENGRHKHAGKRTIIGRIIDATSYGFFNIEVIASDGPNAYGKGLKIQRPAGNILSAEDCTSMVAQCGMQVMKSGGHVEGIKNGEKVVMDSAKEGGIGKGATHADGGIKGIVGTSAYPLEFEKNELILTAPVASDTTLYEFEGKKMTPRQIASKLNVDNGGVSFADGGEIHSCRCSGKTYQYGGNTMSDTDIVNEINRKSQLQKGFDIENREHRETLSRLNDGFITLDQAIAEIAETHLKENRNYYTTH